MNQAFKLSKVVHVGQSVSYDVQTIKAPGGDLCFWAIEIKLT